MARKRAVAAVAAVVAVAVVAALAASRRSDDGARIDIAGGEREAAAACRELVRFSELAHANGSSDDVRDALDAADGRARRALGRDPAWVRLSSGVMALEQALRRDDPVAARTGIDIARDECGRLHVVIP